MPTILMVCTANVCRSQYARLLFSHALDAAHKIPDVLVISAGTNAATSVKPCGFAAEKLTAAGVDFTRSRMLAPRPLDPEEIAQADLILTAERSHRSIVAKIQPEQRVRTFTLVEAEELARRAFGNGHFDVSARTAPHDRFSLFVSQLNATRGVYAIAPPAAARRHSGMKVPEAQLDIEDRHHLKLKEHTMTLREVDRAVDGIVSVLSAVIT